MRKISNKEKLIDAIVHNEIFKKSVGIRMVKVLSC